MKYIRPKAIKSWKHDQPGGELYEVSIMDDQTVISAYGRYAHGSGSKIVRWNDFLSGEMNGLVEKTMGSEVLENVLSELKKIT